MSRLGLGPGRVVVDLPNNQVGDVDSLRSLLNSLRSVDAVFDAYRVTPS